METFLLEQQKFAQNLVVQWNTKTGCIAKLYSNNTNFLQNDISQMHNVQIGLESLYILNFRFGVKCHRFNRLTQQESIFRKRPPPAGNSVDPNKRGDLVG